MIEMDNVQKIKAAFADGGAALLCIQAVTGKRGKEIADLAKNTTEAAEIDVNALPDEIRAAMMETLPDDRKPLIISLLAAVVWWSEATTHTRQIARLQAQIKALQCDLTGWRKAGDEEQVNACQTAVERLKTRQNELKDNTKRIEQILIHTADEDSAESCLRWWSWVQRKYLAAVDGVALQFGIDIAETAKEIGLHYKRNIYNLADVVGGVDAARRLAGEQPDKEQPTKHERVIDVDALKACFTAKFCGRNAAGVDYAENLLADLKQERDAKYYAKIAWMIYNSPSLLRASRPATFAAWYKTFAKIADVDTVNSYKPNKITPTAEEQKQFYYLTQKLN